MLKSLDPCILSRSYGVAAQAWTSTCRPVTHKSNATSFQLHEARASTLPGVFVILVGAFSVTSHGGRHAGATPGGAKSNFALLDWQTIVRTHPSIGRS